MWEAPHQQLHDGHALGFLWQQGFPAQLQDMWQGIPHQAGSSSTPEGPPSTGQQREAHLPRVQSGVQSGDDYEGALGNPQGAFPVSSGRLSHHV